MFSPEFILTLLGIFAGLADSIDILTIIILLIILKNKNKLKNYTVFLLTYLILSIIQGIIVIIFTNRLINLTTNHFTLLSDFIYYIIGFVIMLFGIHSVFFDTPKPINTREYKKNSIKEYILLATLLTIMGTWDSIIYFGYLFKVTSVNLGMPFELFSILIYNFFYFLPYIIIYLLYKKYQQKSEKYIHKIIKIFNDKNVYGLILFIIGLYIAFN